MAHSERFRSFVRSTQARPAGLVALGALLAACQSILGIEELSSDPDPSKGGMGQAGNTTGATSGKGGSTSGGTAGSTAARGGTGGSTGGSAGAGARGGSVNGGDSGSGPGGTAGTGGTAGNGTGGSSGGGGTSSGSGGEGGMPPESSPITGKLIDFWRHPIPNVAVYVGDATGTTDENGEFTIADVPPTYDAAFVIQLDDPARAYEWAFLGLTRRDPTLQVYEGLPHYEAHFYVTQTGAPPGGFDDDQWLLGAGSDHGADTASAGPGGFDRRPYWWGPNMADWTLHSLFLEREGKLPSNYVAYETMTATTDGSMVTTEQDFEVDLTMQSIDKGKISGAIVDNTGVGRTNSVFLRFTSGAPVALVDEVDASANSYEYTVPSLPNASVTIAAAETQDDDSYSIAHRDNREIGDTGIDLVIPPPVSGLVPLDGAVDVGLDTTFSFGGGDTENSGYLIHIENVAYRQGLFIVTANRQVKLSDVQILHDVIAPNAYHNWLVETHGKFASVDAMAGPNGFMDEFGNNNLRPQGPSRSDGAFTTTGLSYFTTAAP